MKTLGFIAFVLISSLAVAQSDTAFIYTYGGGGDDEGKDILQTSDGGYIILGSTSSFGNGSSDLYVLKLDSNFQVEWTNAYGGPQIEVGEAILPSDDGGYHLIGYTNSFGSGGYDVFVVKIDSLGNEDWQDTYGGANWDFAYDATRDSLGNIYIVGETYSFGNGAAQAYVLKVGEFGGLIWEKDFGGEGRDIANAISFSPDSNYVLTGETTGITDTTDSDIWLLKFNDNGDILEEFGYGGIKYDVGHDITFDSAHYYIAGSSKSFSLEDDLNEYVVKVDTSGVLIWGRDRKQNGNGTNLDDEGFGISLRPNGRILVTGAGRTFGAGSADMIISDLGTSGFESPVSGSFGEFLTDIGYKIFSTNNQNLFILGKTNSYGPYYDVGLMYMDTTFKISSNDLKLQVKFSDTTTTSNPELEVLQGSSTSQLLEIKEMNDQIELSNRSSEVAVFQVYDLMGRILNSGEVGAMSSIYIDLVKGQLSFLRFSNSSERRSIQIIAIE